MRKQFFTSALLFVAILSFGQSEILKSNRLSAAIKVDGDPSDWQMPLRFYDETTKLFFDFVNDNNNLYLCFQSNDNAEEMKIMRAGMTITLKIKSNGKASIKFPLPQTDIDKTSLLNNTMEIKGFKTKDGIISINDKSGINAAMGNDDARKLTYEVAIPLKEISGDDYVKDFSKEIQMDVEIHALKQGSQGGERNGSGKEGSGRMGGGGGHRGGGGMGGGGRQGGMQRSDDSGNTGMNSERASMFEKSEFKQKFTLAKQ